VIRCEQALFGTQPSVVFMQKLPFLALSEVFYLAYFSYYAMIGGVGLALYIRNRRQFLQYVSVVSFLFYICYVFYIVFPLIGPPVFFHPIDGYTLPAALQHLAPTNQYPDAVKHGVFFRLMAWIYRGFESPGAALPSSHVAVALCTLYFSFRYLRPIRYVHLVAVILLCLSTMYCRYHYAVDVLAGMLTAALVVPFGNWLYFKTKPIDDSKPASADSKTINIGA
jgi:membrane-associated phospholipid phosphatase